jgi:predicted nucleotidyltransferase/DNA-binding Xre family transcriptional regulator
MKIDAGKLGAILKSRGLTNTSLAARAGITRQALHSMLKQDRVIDVRATTGRGLAEALQLPDVSLLSPDPLVGYEEAVADAHAKLTFSGLGLPTTEPRSMDELYVPIRVVRMPNREHDQECDSWSLGTEDRPIEESDPVTVEECLSLHRRILIRGEPGSGKTTALRHAARAYALAQIANSRSPKQSRIPLFVRLADFAKARELDRDMTLVRFVVTHTLRDGSPEYWAEVQRNIEVELGRGNCIVLLDGLDEVGGEGDSSNLLRRFVNRFSQNQFVLSSRIIGLDAGPWRKLGFVTFQVARWRADDIRDFAVRWYADRLPSGRKPPKKQLGQQAQELAAGILTNRAILEIASNPLMLTILAALHHANAALPRRRIDLYAKIVEVMLETWEKSKRVALPGDPLHGIVLEAREFCWLLARFALAMQRDGRILRPRWWVTDFARQFLMEQMAFPVDQVKEQSERVVRYLCERTGLLVERGDGVFGFWHRTFQEYFASRGLLLEAEGGDDLVKLLRPFLFHPQWEEVVVYVAASVSATRATTMARVILDDPDPAGRFLRRGQRLVLRCLVEGAVIADRELLNQVFSDGETIGRSRWLGIAIAFIDLLKKLLVTRHEGDAQRMAHDIEDAAKKELPDEDYIPLYASLHGLPDGPRDAGPGITCRKRLGSRKVELVWAAWPKRFDDPDSWYREVLRTLRDRKSNLDRRLALISLIGQEPDANDAARHALKQLLVRDRRPEVRAACAVALEQSLPVDSAIAELLIARLDGDTSGLVRQACAQMLRSIAPHEPAVRARLEKLFKSGPEAVRAGAARGLSGLDFTSPAQNALLKQFMITIATLTEPVHVRCAAISAIATALGFEQTSDVDDIIEKRLDDSNPKVRMVALHAIADAIVEGRKAWSRPLVEKIEKMLMAVTEPCVHLFSDLSSIVAMKEVLGSWRLERLLGEALAPFGELIRIAFVFGSVARREQVRDSDIDLMIVGDVRLKELAAALHSAEQLLGRTVNPMLFSREKFREQYREGNPLLLDVARKQRIFLKGSPNELTELVADRSSD